MNTPVFDFVKQYNEKNMSRLHMPGHKGRPFLGCEAFDITEVSGADALYEAEGIIAESEANAAYVFGTGRTVYSTEGSSQCIRGMLYLAVNHWKSSHKEKSGRPAVVAARNVHKAFVYAAALLDFDIVWLWPEGDHHSLCSCPVSPSALQDTLERMETPPAAVYLTSPDYLGGQQPLNRLAEICHEYGTILAVDNAHGAYLKFLTPSGHPIDLGADICCDSAHKTLPVLTGGAYLHISRHAPESFRKNVKSAMALFGSTSPSYLTLCSLDLCNRYLTEGYEVRIREACEEAARLRSHLEAGGWQCEGTEPLKITVRMPEGITGTNKAEELRACGVECEFADPDYLVLMVSPENREEDYEKVLSCFGENHRPYSAGTLPLFVRCPQKISVREAVFSEHEELLAEETAGRICGSPTVSCPPAIPVVVSGEEITKEAIEVFRYYDIKKVYCIEMKKTL